MMRAIFLAFLSAFTGSAAASAQEAIQYTYDARGRLIAVTRSSGLSSGVTSTYAYDKADNRTLVTVSGSGTNPWGTPGASIGERIYVVVPLNGYTLIRTQ